MQTYDPHKTTSEVRQGSGRLQNFRVMIISLGLVVIAFAIIFIVYFATKPPTAM